MHESALEGLEKVLLSGYIGQGPKVEEFEKGLSPWVGNQNILTVNAGTSALHLALRLANVTSDSEVISTPMTCSATNSPIMERGATIVWADINPWTGNIDPVDVERKITSKTKAILAVHWGGYPCDLDQLYAISKKYGIPLIEDAAHAFGATYKDQPIGSGPSLTCFSFQAIKLLTTGDGGLLCCPSMQDYRRGKLLRWFGIDREAPRKDLRVEEDILEYGYKFHMNDISASIGLDQLKYTKGLLETAQANALYYDRALSGLKKVSKLDYRFDRKSSYWLYTIRVDGRESFQEYMKSQGVMVSQVHVRNDIHTAFKAFRRSLPGVDEFSKYQVSIPVGWWVEPQDIQKVSEAIAAWDKL